ncbi:hypothetical protein ACRGNN_003858 [Providencia stuartii]|uniref:hypothetical protein n=1 Tax=Providencia stuartii TaxID=588 RepID=UPI0018C5DB81|nr:hypothetical protein [Providencia stuartii]EMD1719174.1 hypothetical protein [Providencia stuartii]MBG5909778.1 hypothetical protein [Providencia stuartii]WAZ74136.1 hypothetical protein O4Z98_16235 [Providencia stuartii]HAU5735368.1 hypothetical protein [Providencia stuartii]HAU5775918.1 hypothetical protein [Providencia stuartii]
MNRMELINKYIETELKDIEVSTIDLKKKIDSRFYKDIEIDITRKPVDKYINYLVALDSAMGITGLLYTKEIYSNVNEKSYAFEKFFWHRNVSFLASYYNLFKDKNLSLDFSEQGEILLMDFACDDFRIGHLCYDRIIENILSGKMAKSLPMYTRPQKLGVFAVEMLASEKNQTIDWESAGIPIDPFYQRFCQEALYNENHDVVAQWLIALCDRHVEWSALFDWDENEQSATGYEIDMEILLAWPFEYQAVKNFRAKHGLTTPIIDHPLLKTPMAIEHRPDMVGWKQNRPAVYDQMIEDLITINTELQVIHKLF